MGKTRKKSAAQLRSSGATLIGTAVVLIVIGLVAFISMQRDLTQYETEGTRDFNLLAPEDLEGKPYVHGYVESVFEVYAEEYTTVDGVRKSDDSDKLYYLIPMFGDESITYFISIEATPPYYSKLESIYDWTWDYTTTAACPELYLEDARIKPLSSDMEDILYDWCATGQFYESGSFVDWCVEYDFYGTSDEDAILSYVLPYMIVPDQTPVDATVPMLIMAGVGVLLLVLGIRRLARAKAAAAAETASVAENAFAPAAAGAPVAPAPEDVQQPAAAPESPAATPAGDQPSAFCTNCGAALESGRKFCPNCGAKAGN